MTDQEMEKRKQLNEPPFGEKLAPVLEELSKAVWEHKARVEFQNHNEEYYYKKVLDEYKKTKEGRR